MRKALAAILLGASLAGPVLSQDIAGPAGRFIKFGDSIDRLGDVDTTGKTTGSCFVYDGVSEQWEAALCAGSSGASALQVAIGGVQLSSPTASVNFSSFTFSGTESPSGTANVSLIPSSVTLQGNTFNAASKLLQIDSSGLVPNNLIDSSSVTKVGPTIDLATDTTGNYVASLVAGTAITVGSAGEAATPTVSFDPTGLTGNNTFADGSNSTVIWCVDVLGTDPCFTFTNNHIAVASITASSYLSAAAAVVGGQNVCLEDGTNCQDFSGNEANIAISSGGSTGSVEVSSPTSQINFSSHTFTVTLDGTTTAFIQINPSSVTLLGPTVTLGTETSGIYVASITITAPLTISGGSDAGAANVLDIDRSSFTLLGPTLSTDEIPAHGELHEDGQPWEIDVTDLSGVLADPQNVAVLLDGSPIHTSTGLNFISGENVTLTIAADGGETDITIASTGIAITTGTTDIAVSTRIAFTGTGGIEVSVTEHDSSATITLDGSGVVGLGDAVLASTQTFSGINTFSTHTVMYRVGIGTDSPAAPIHVKGTAEQGIRLEQTTFSNRLTGIEFWRAQFMGSPTKVLEFGGSADFGSGLGIFHPTINGGSEMVTFGAFSSDVWGVFLRDGGVVRFGDATDYIQIQSSVTAVVGPQAYVLPISTGTAGQVLSTDGGNLSQQLSWITPSGGASSSVSSFTYTFNPDQAKLPESNPAVISNSTNAITSSLLYDASTDESVTWSTTLTPHPGGTLTVDLFYSMASATSGDVVMTAELMCVSPDDAADLDTASFAAAGTVTDEVPATAGYMAMATITPTDDSCAEGDLIVLRVTRDANNGSDDAAGDLELRKARLYAE